MKKILVTPLFLLATIFAAHAADSLRAQSSPGPMKDTVKTVLAGWQLAHFPDNEAKFLMIGNAKRPVAAITDYPDSLEIRAFNGSSGEFITVRDKDHDGFHEEIEGLSDGTILKLEGGAYKLSRVEGQWSLTQLP